MGIECWNKCPHGHKFGEDIDDYTECKGCAERLGCIDKYNKLIPPEVKTCHTNPLLDDCSKCKNRDKCEEYQTQYTQIPNFIIDRFLPKLSPSACKIYIFLCRAAIYSKSDGLGMGNSYEGNNFGRCWFTLKQIEDATGVAQSNMRKYLIALKHLGLIEYSISRKPTSDSANPVKTKRKYTTLHIFTVTSMKRFKKMNHELHHLTG